MASPNKDVFACDRCGGCCRDIKRKFPETPHKILFRTGSNENIGLPLFEWEMKKLEEEAEKRGSEISIKPLQYFHDKKTEKAVIVTWHLDHSTCPFLGDNSCTIYENRPSICRMFPVIDSGVFSVYLGKKEISLPKTVCRNNLIHTLLSGEVGLKDYTKAMLSYYCTAFEEAVQADLINLYMAKTIRSLYDKKLIEPVIFPEAAKFQKPIPLFQFLISLSVETDVSVREKISDFMSLRNAKNTVENIIGSQ